MTDGTGKSEPERLEMTLRVDFSRAGLLGLRDRIDELLGHMPGEPERIDSDPELTGRKLAELRPRLKGPSWDFLVACARHWDRGETFTLDDVAGRMGIDVGKVKAYRRNLARSEKQIDQQLGPGSPPLFETEWDGRRSRLRVHDLVHEALRSPD